MKKTAIMALGMVFCSIYSFAQTFASGDKIVSASIGAGTIKFRPVENGATFIQRVSMEWCVKDKLLDNNAAIGIGVILDNSYGGKYTGRVFGTYDYTYDRYRHTKGGMVNGTRYTSSVEKVNTSQRFGGGYADADMARDDLKALMSASFHYQPIKNLDTYATMGLGLGIICHTQGNYRNGDEDIEVKNYVGNTFMLGGLERYDTYSYNDYDHIEWSDKPDTKVAFSFAFFIGARYYFTPKWAANMELGLLSSVLRKSYGHGFDIFAVGVSYKL